MTVTTTQPTLVSILNGYSATEVAQAVAAYIQAEISDAQIREYHAAYDAKCEEMWAQEDHNSGRWED